MQQFPGFWTIIDKVDFLQRKLLLNSIAERQYGINLMGNEFRDGLIQQLIDIQNQYAYNVEFQTLYGYAFRNFEFDKYRDLYFFLNEHDREQIDKIEQQFSKLDNMTKYYMLEEYINREV